jgi:exodeoxyribonuclease VII small subunit
MAKKKTDGIELTFEQALARLEEIVSALESGEEALEEAIALFEEGSRLSQFCQEKLAATQEKIEKLIGAKEQKGEKQTPLSA